MRALIFAVAFASTGTASAGPCAIRPLSPHPMTANGTELPPGGGVLVSLSDMQDWNARGQPDLTKTSWKFVDGRKASDPVIKILAPGLALFEPPAGASSIKLVDGKRIVATHPRTTTARRLLPAPVITAIDHVTSAAIGPRQAARNTVTAQLTGERPDGAVAIILFAAGTPASWTSAFSYTGPKGSIELWHTTGRCETAIPGLVATQPGTKVTAAWVDASGRLGARSKELVVGSRVGP